MSINLANHYVQQYSTNIDLLLQQTGSKLRNTVTVGSYTGKAASPVDQIGKVEMQAVASRFAPMGRVDAATDRRWVYPSDYDLPQASADSHGGTLGLDVLVGGTPSKGLALGGALLNEAGVSHSVEQRGRSLGDSNVRLSLLGPFVDGFFDAKGGFHMGAAVGFASLAIEDLSVEGDTDTLTGLGGAAW